MSELRRRLSWMRNTDILIALGVITILVMLIIPIPTFLLDFGLAVNISATLVIMLTVMYISKATEFSVFPTLILFTTLFRIALNVSSTRLILLQGQNFNGEIIKAFGNFVVGGNYLIGLVIFLILVAVQVMVITKGATRVSEVAARFTLDALPGKQMEITNELSANLITEEDAKAKKKEVQKEADFYGAMDGASKFVQGDVRLGVIIIVINIIGGLVVGTVQQGLSFAEAGKLFLQLTVGDGLVTQIPSLLMSLATGVIVTRAASDGSLGDELARELTFSPKPLFISAAFLMGLSILPGFPTISMLLLASLMIGLGYYVHVNGPVLKVKEAVPEEKEQTPQNEEEDIFRLINIDPMELEIGYSLISLVDAKQGGDLLERIKLIRRTMALELGLVIPPIRIRDNMRLASSDYVIKVKGIEIGSGSLRIDSYLAIPPFKDADPIDGIDGMDPVFKTPAKWIKEEQRPEAEKLGYSVVDSPTVIATHLTEIFRNEGFELLGRQEVKKILDSVREENNVIVGEVEKIGIGEIQKVLQNLLRDGVSIRNIVSILEVMADCNSMGLKNIDVITEKVRGRLGKQIIQQYTQSHNLDLIQVITLEPEWENLFENSIEESEMQMHVHVEPGARTQFLNNTAYFLEQLNAPSSPIVVCSDRIRPLVKDFIRASFPKLKVFSYTEVAGSDVKVDHLGTIPYEVQSSVLAEETETEEEAS